MTILITGGCGFVGSSLAIYFKHKYPDYTIIALDNLKRKGSHLNLDRLNEAGVEFIHGDIRNKEDFDTIGKVDMVIDASAEPSVLAGISGDPEYLINTNLNGTIHCLSFAKKNSAGFIFLSTSRVYPIEVIENANYEELQTRFQLTNNQTTHGISAQGITEDLSTVGYRSFYGATKLASELIINEYNQFYELKSVINRCGVLTGPWQMGKVDQGVVVLWVARHFWKKKLNYIGYGGTGKQVRDILHIKDLFELIDYQAHNLDKVNGETFNVGGGNDVSISLQELTLLCEKITGNKINIEKIADNRMADVRIYVTDNTKVNRHTGWKPKTSPQQIIKDIYEWLIANEKKLKYILS
jgi:CDP-paratose 2-epimerase